MVRFCYGPTNLSPEGVVRCETCVTRPLVEMWSDLVIVRLCYGPSYLTAGHKRTQVAKFTRWKAVDVTVLTGQHVLSKQCPLFLSSLRQCALYDKLIELFEHMHYAHKYRRKWGVTWCTWKPPVPDWADAINRSWHAADQRGMKVNCTLGLVSLNV